MPSVTRDLLDQAVARGIVSTGQSDELWRFFGDTAPPPASGPGFTFTNVL